MLSVHNRLDFTNLNEYEFTYWMEVDGKKARENTIILDCAPHATAALSIEYMGEECQYGVYLNTSLKKNGKEYAVTQHKLPCAIIGEEKSSKAALTEDKQAIYAFGEGFSYVFSKHYGTFTSIIIDGEEQLADKIKLSAFRAPTDNDRHMKKAWASYNNWESENLDVTFNKVYSCEIKDGAIVVEGALAAVSRVPLMKHTLTVTVHDDGVIDFSLSGNVRQNGTWLTRLGFEWTLPQDSSAFSYCGHGPIESYRDMCHYAHYGYHGCHTWNSLQRNQGAYRKG